MIALLAVALGGSTLDAQRQAELDRVRAQVADQIHLAAFDLVDELVYGWTRQPVFEQPTPVVLAGVGVPVGLGTGLQARVENHLAEALRLHPTAHLQLAHCPACTAVIVRSGPEGTRISRGIDDPAVLADRGADTGQHALFVDIEAEGSWLVLRARITRLSPALPIVWSHTLTSSAGRPALLRAGTTLKSAEEAREEYLDALRDRGPLHVPVRLAVRTFARGQDGGLPPPPILWLQSGVELGVNEARAWTSSLILGYSFIPDAYQGIMAQGRIQRLLTGRMRSRTRPDLYGFVGASAMSLWGDAVVPLGDRQIALGGWHLGLDLRVGNRIGISGFIENQPALSRNEFVGSFVRLWGLRFHSLGTEVTFWF